MSALDEFRSGIDEMCAAFGKTATINGVSYNVIDESVRYGEDLISGGREKEHTLTLIVGKRAGMAEPLNGSVVVFEGRQYGVTSYVSDCATYTITCTDKHQKP